jgi:para-nitrobenzyl esterase
MVWVHGGAFTQGLGNCALYNGSTFAQKNVISVVLNYRLGALGYLASPSMEGNYGILDQRAAMQWVVDNVAAFGGNPKAITLAGQSAGAMSVGIHMVSPNSQGLFQQGSFEAITSKDEI